MAAQPQTSNAQDFSDLVRQLVAAAPPLEPETEARLRGLFRSPQPTTD